MNSALAQFEGAAKGEVEEGAAKGAVEGAVARGGVSREKESAKSTEEIDCTNCGLKSTAEATAKA